MPIRKLFLPCGINHSGNYEDIFFFQSEQVTQKKGDLTSESFSLWLQSLLGAKNYPKHLLFRWIELKNRDLTHILGDWSQSAKLSEVKPPFFVLLVQTGKKYHSVLERI